MDAETRTNLIINHIPHNIKDDDFHRLFSEFGTIRNYRIMKDLQTGTSYGYGFVDYETSEMASKAILRMNNFQIQNKHLKVSFAQPPEGAAGDKDAKSNCNVYIANLPMSITQDYLQQVFINYGKIEDMLIFKDKVTGLAKGIAFVRFASADEAQNAINEMNGQSIDGSTQPMIVRQAKEKKDPAIAEAYQKGYQAGLLKAQGRGGGGRLPYDGRGGFSSSYGYGGMGYGQDESSMTGLTDFSGRKMPIDRSNNRYNPIGGMGSAGPFDSYSQTGGVTPSFSQDTFTNVPFGRGIGTRGRGRGLFKREF